MTDFVTKDSGERVEFDSGMHRDTSQGKPRFDLMLPEGVPYEEQMLTRLAALLARGAVKYDARNWELANSEEELKRFKESAFRHFLQWITGEADEDHAAAVMFNIIAAETLRSKLRAISAGALEEAYAKLTTLATSYRRTFLVDEPQLGDRVRGWDKDGCTFTGTLVERDLADVGPISADSWDEYDDHPYAIREDDEGFIAAVKTIEHI